MSIETVVMCDVCVKIRGATNHWQEFFEEQGVVTVSKFEGRGIRLQTCGSECAHALLDRWLTTGSLDANRHEDVPNS